jgi:hypothetical protein
MYLINMGWGTRHMDVGMRMVIMPAMQHSGFSLKTGMAGVETAQATQHQTNPIAPRWTFRVRTH